MAAPPTNRGIHALQLRWGRATRLIICPDTIGLVATLVRLAQSGNEEAGAAPITDEIVPADRLSVSQAIPSTAETTPLRG